MTTTQTPEICWQDPPPASLGKGRPSKWAPVIAELASRPGEWALICSDAYPSITANIKRVGANVGVKIETATRGPQNGRADIYARVVAS